MNFVIPYFTFTQTHLGPVTIQVWGLMVSLGFLFALFLSIHVGWMGLDHFVEPSGKAGV